MAGRPGAESAPARGDADIVSTPHGAGWRRPLALAAATIVLIGLAGFAAWSAIEGRGAVAGQDSEDQPVAPPARVLVQDGVAVVTLDPQDQQKDGIRTERLTVRAFAGQVQAFGRVLDPQPLTALADAAARAAAQVQIARARLAASQTAFARAQHLYRDEHNMSAAQLQAAEAAFHIDEAGVAAAEAALLTVTRTARQAWGPALGQAAIDQTPRFTRLLAQQDVLVQVTLRPGQAIAAPPAEAFVRGDGGARIPLRFVSPATRTDPRIQGRSFLYTAPANSGLLPGMSVVACLADGRVREGAAIPVAAIVWGQGRAWAYFRTGHRTFARRMVATDWPAPGDGYVVRDERQGTEVVVEGAQMLFSEEFRSQLQADD